MENFNRIIESLSVRYIKARNLVLLKPLEIENYFDVENTIIYLNKGDVIFNDVIAKEGSILFIPAGRTANLAYITGGSEQISYQKFIGMAENFFDVNKNPDIKSVKQANYILFNFEAKIFDSVNFFSSLDIPPFIIKNAPIIEQLVLDIFKEQVNKDAGRDLMLKNNTERMVIEIIRHIINNKLFVEQLVTNATYFKDPRLVNVFTYIKANLDGDLSNKALAVVAEISEDYVGQYFKVLTGINPQDYIEYQRMEGAIHLLRTSNLSIAEISNMVGYKGTAYFCRRFKMMFGIPAGRMRKRDSLINLDD